MANNTTNNTTDKVEDNQYFIYDGSNDYIEKENKEIKELENRGNAFVKKYKEMANMRRDYEDIEPRLPPRIPPPVRTSPRPSTPGTWLARTS